MNRREFAQISALAAFGFALPASLNAFHKSGKRIKVGVIGTYHSHTEDKINTLIYLNDIYELIAVAEEDAVRRNNSIGFSNYGKINWITKRELLSRQDLNAVLIESSMDDLLSDALEAVEAGKHIHIDNPPGRNLENLKYVLNEATKNDLAFQLGYFTRYNNAVIALKKFLSEGIIGDVFEIDGVFSKKIPDSRRESIKKYYGGSMFFLGCYLIELVVSIFGFPESIKTYCRNSLNQADGLLDNQLAILEYKNCIASLRSSLLEIDGETRRHIDFVGTNGTLEINPFEPGELYLTLGKSSGNYSAGRNRIALPLQSDRYSAQLKDFAAMIRKEKPVYYGARKEIEIHETLLKASNLF
ncbi:MAG TPA: Gfo/Idh/MocA family oxidoreductase [Melioribacteraceae bacterium]|nr:Gfo/Idh/MocA family oxidoreductase [Melioribacteraceae bacterium]